MYEKMADETLEALADYFEDLTDEAFTGAEYDVVFSVSHYFLFTLTLTAVQAVLLLSAERKMTGLVKMGHEYKELLKK